MPFCLVAAQLKVKKKHDPSKKKKKKKKAATNQPNKQNKAKISYVQEGSIFNDILPTPTLDAVWQYNIERITFGTILWQMQMPYQG